MEKYSLSNTMAVSVLNDFYQASNNYELKYYDCLKNEFKEWNKIMAKK